jgi:TonB family protein
VRHRLKELYIIEFSSNLKNTIMKKSVIFLAGMVITMIAAGQNQRTMEEITPPKFSAGETFIQGRYFATVDDYLMHTVQYPQEAVNSGNQGTEVVKFVVTPSGDVTSFSVINSVSAEIDEEVIRMLQSTSGLWQPGSINGEVVAMEKEVSVAFKLHPTGDFVSMAKDYLKLGNKMLLKGNTRKALSFYDKAVTLLPNEEALLAVRGMCRYQTGDTIGAATDCERLKSLGYFDNHHAETEYASGSIEDLKEFAERISLVRK